MQDRLDNLSGAAERTLYPAPTRTALAGEVAARLVTALVDAQQARGSASVVLTGGGIGIETLQAFAAEPGLGAVDLGALDVWWGDERFVAASDPDRNAGQALEALGGALDGARVHPMGDSDAFPDPEAAAAAYAEELGTGHVFDVLLLGIGPEGHVASIFPHSPASTDERDVFAVHDCPKPPPTRVSLGYAAIRRAREVWIIASGDEKADAVRRLRDGTEGPLELPAAGAVGIERTLLFADAAALGSPPT